MIAAGLCLMGGCFAQDGTSRTLDAYWPSQCVKVPPYTDGPSIGLFQYDVVPAGVHLDDCYMITRQSVIRPNEVVGFFAVFQGDAVVYNSYTNIQNNTVELAYADTPGSYRIANSKPLKSYPVEVLVECDASGMRAPLHDVVTPPTCWDSDKPGRRLLILDVRNSDKNFFVSYGQWGWKWYLLPMRSAKQESAVFDIEMKILVEL